jgi:hypothetical protein
MKLEVLVANEEALKSLVETKFDDAQLAWDLAESFDEVEKAITKFQKMRDEYVKENGTPSEDNPDRFSIPDPEAFSKEMQKLLAVEVDIKFPSFAIAKLKGLKVSVKEMRSWKALGIISNVKPAPKVEEPIEIQEADKVKAKEVKDTPNT